MHAPKALRLGETILRLPPAKGSEHLLRSQEVNGPIGPHFPELLPQNATRLPVVNDQIQPARDRHRNSRSFTVSKRIDSGSAHDVEKEIQFLACKRDDRKGRGHLAQRVPVAAKHCACYGVALDLGNNLFRRMAWDSQGDEDGFHRLGRQQVDQNACVKDQTATRTGSGMQGDGLLGLERRQRLPQLFAFDRQQVT